MRTDTAKSLGGHLTSAGNSRTGHSRLSGEGNILGASPHTALAVAVSAVLGFLAITTSDAQAGDILRGGAARGGARPAGTAGGRANAAQLDGARTNARDTLARTTQSIQAVQAMQKAARDIAVKGPNHLGIIPRTNRPLPNVPNGLAVGGLQVAPGVPKNLKNPQTGENANLWVGANLPKQSKDSGRTVVTIEQTKQQALLNWRTFNIGKETTLKFDQSRGKENKSQWIAFNKINDPSGVPSQILGNIEAPGQVYILNQNGILFGGSSQINLHGLVASSLPINDNLVTRGLLNNPDYQFLFSSLSIPALTSGGTMPGFTPPAAPNTPGGKIGDVVVQKGAQLISPTTPERVGGRIALVGANVRNEGTISTPDGQTILAAGLQVGLTPHASNDPSLRGLDVVIGKVREPAPPTPAPTPQDPNPVAPPAPAEYAGTATNTGYISAPRANVTIAGKTVNQFGVIESSTSVNLNGRVDLLANYNAITSVVLNKPRFSSTATGTISLGTDSLISILPEYESTDTIPGTKLPISSQINFQGRNIHLENNALLFAPSATISLSSGEWLPLNGDYAFTYSKGGIHLEAGAQINAAGSVDVSVPVSQNILSLELRGAELADSPVQRDGILRGPTLNVDIRNGGYWNGAEWVGTPLGDVSGYVGLIKRNVGELTTAGGTVKINAGNSVVLEAGSEINVSGGWINFEGGLVETTRVISDGEIFTLADATPDRIYTGIYDGTFTKVHPKYGIFTTYQHALALSGSYYEQGYTQGASGGSIAITAPSMVLDGKLTGETFAGERQREKLPHHSALALSFIGQDASDPVYPFVAPKPPNIVFQNAASTQQAVSFAQNATANRRPELVLSPELLTTDGFGSLKIFNPGGNITVPAGVALHAPEEGEITLDAANIEIEGDVIAPGGSLNFTAYNIPPALFNKLKITQNAQTPAPFNGRGSFTLGSNATLSTAGLLVDDRPGAPFAEQLPLVLNGGTISIKSYSATLSLGSLVDVSGGARIRVNDDIEFDTDSAVLTDYGHGGTISVITGQDPNIASVTGGQLKLGATLKGYSGTHGGTLKLQAPAFQIGGKAGSGVVHLDPGFFSEGGFANFTLTGLGLPGAVSGEYVPGIHIANGTKISPVVESWLAIPASPESGGFRLEPFLKPALRNPAHLSFAASGVRDIFTGALKVRGDVVMGEGSLITTDPGGSVDLHGDTALILGSINAPGGSISIRGAKDSIPLFINQTEALPTVYIGADSRLSVAGATVLTPNIFGNRTGYVLPGGEIHLTGNIVAATGALLDVSGTSSILDLPPPSTRVGGLITDTSIIPNNSGINSTLALARTVPTRIDSDAGSIVFSGGQMLYTDATLRGEAGGPTALGGSLSISSGRFYAPDNTIPASPLDVTLVVTQNGGLLPSFAGSGSAIGKSLRDFNGNVLPGVGNFGVNHFAEGGFEALSLNGTVQFQGPVSIQARRELSVADGGVLFADSAVTLTAPYVKLGQPFETPLLPEQQQSPFEQGGQPFHFDPTHGTGSLTVRAGLVDIGTLSLQNIGKASIIADGGDIRGQGTLDIAGDLYLRAAQIYPPTALTFTIAASDYQIGTETRFGSVTIEGSGTRQLPLSAGGTLNIFGSIINQSGVLRAPLGSINLGWDGTGTAPQGEITGENVAVTQKVTLSGGSITSVSGLGADGQPLLVPFGINLNGVSWIDPLGEDITAGGVPQKTVSIAGLAIDSQAGSVIDLRGGGDLLAYRWVKGNGGTKDVLASDGSFAVIPGYDASYSPFSPYNPDSLNGSLGDDPGFVNEHLRVGDRVYLGASEGLAAGNYTLLPARYALLPGAFLVTPKDGVPFGTLVQTDGSTLVPGYRFNGLNKSRSFSGITSNFEVASATTVGARSEYALFSGNAFLSAGAQINGVAAPRLPTDAGHLILQATTAMSLQGRVLAEGANKGRGGLVDIASPVDILINGSGSGGSGQLVLNAAQLSAFGAESLLIGGVRQFTANGTTVTVKTGNLTLDNRGTPLTGPEIILAANRTLTLADGAQITQSGTVQGGADDLVLGSTSVAGSGNGTLVRVTSDPSARITRNSIGGSTDPNLVVGSGVTLTGASLTLDSTYGTSLDDSVILDGDYIALNSGRISLLLDDTLSAPATFGLVLAGNTLENLKSAQSLSLLSYSSLDIYGAGSFGGLNSLALHAGEIRGFNNGGGLVTLSANSILLDNIANSTVPGSVPPLNGTLAFNAGTIRIGANQMAVDQFANVELNATKGIVFSGEGGLKAQGNLTATTPSVTARQSSTQSLNATGNLVIQAPASGGSSRLASGLGASLSLEGASVDVSSDIRLPSGLLTLRARTGNLTIGGDLDVSGTSQTFYDLVKYTSGGQINLISDAGTVTVNADASINVSVPAGGGNAGSLSVSARNGANGAFVLAGELEGNAGAGGNGGSFSLDVGSLDSYAALGLTLSEGGFTESQNIRVRTGNVTLDGLARAHEFHLSLDQLGGNITVTGTVDASGLEGGDISLAANGSVTLAGGALLDASAEDFNAAGKGGSIRLEAGVTRNGVAGTGSVSIQNGSAIDLSVASNNASSASLGQFSGTLHLRAPQTTGNADVRISPIDGSVTGASKIVIEGFNVFDLTSSGGLITSTVQNSVFNNGVTFAGLAGTAGNTVAISNRLLANNAGLTSALIVQPGAEIINRSGDLTLGTTSSPAASDWNLAPFRFGPNNAPGVLTLRAFGNLAFYNALSDGFTSSAYNATLLAQNPLLAANAQTWSYRMTAGADFTASDFHRVRQITNPSDTLGSLLLGKNAGTNSGANSASTLTSSVIANRFQVIRTGSGDIDISARQDVQLLNHFATIYTAGTQVTDATLGGTFDLPAPDFSTSPGALGVVQQNPTYPAQYSLAGGNVSIRAGHDIVHYTRDNADNLIADSERQMPVNWLYRRGFLDGNEFGTGRLGDIASTTWWVDFSNFFEGIGTLGGGNLSLVAGNDIENVDGLVATNARMPGKNVNGDAIAPDAATLVELGGGDLLVKAGNNIDGGVFYVERGRGELSAGNTIRTNSTRSPSPTTLNNSAPLPEETWLPTTLFLGKGSFDVSARNDLLLGPVSNPFLLPGGYNNSFWYKTYFSTYSPSNTVDVSSLAGTVTLRTGTTLPTAGNGAAIPMLQAWFQRNLVLDTGSSTATAAAYQPWLRLNETNTTPFSTLFGIMPATLRVTAFSNDLNVVGDITLAPSSTGTLEFLADGAIHGLQPNGFTSISGTNTRVWGVSTINVSDANPAAIPGIASPYAFQKFVNAGAIANTTDNLFLKPVDLMFQESGATSGINAVLQTKQALHATGPLHANDDQPLRFYAGGGDISGVTLFSPKAAQVFAARDITDIALYVQNVSEDDISVVAAGRDIIAYNPNSALRIEARSAGNDLNFDSSTVAGDIQISGPGALEVLAGRNLDLGIGPNNGDGTALGITSIGNARNPNLSFEGADIITAAGIGSATSLGASTLDFAGYQTAVSESEDGELSAEQRNLRSLDTFFATLRDAGRNYATVGNYDSGFEAIAALFPGAGWKGDISLTSRQIKTQSGGDVTLLAPGGGLTVGFDVAGSQPLDQGILTEAGGNISIFTHEDVVVGTSRIFTLRGGSEIIWSSTGDIAAGASSKTVQSAPPTRVVIDPQSADVQTDLAGLATGGGIGVLATVSTVPPGDVDLIAPKGAIDAGDAGIRVSGNLNIAATQVLNAENISVSGSSVGTPAPTVVAAPNLAGITSASNTAGAASNTAQEVATKARDQATAPVEEEEEESIFTVEVIGYGGGEGTAVPVEAPTEAIDLPTPNPVNPETPADSEEEKNKRKRKKQQQEESEQTLPKTA